MNISIVWIYKLVDPRSSSVFYVGRTTDTLKKRLSGHLSQSKVSDCPKSVHIREIIKAGFQPEIVEIVKLENCTREEAIAAEDAWIWFYGLTAELKNHGKGIHGQFSGDSRIELPEWVINSLGTMSDQELGDLAGVSKSRICEERNRRNIQGMKVKSSLKIEWSSEILAMLGTVSDNQIAKKFGISNSVVTRKRRELRISVYEGDNPIVWTPDTVELLGVVPDTRIGETLGCSGHVVRRKREELGIAAPDVYNKIHLPGWAIAALGKEPDYKIAQRCGVSKPVIRDARHKLNIPAFGEAKEFIVWSDEQIEMLGVISDIEIAKTVGYSLSTVRRMRQKLGISQPPKTTKTYQPSKQLLEFWTENKVLMLGKLPDIVLAEQFKCSVIRVRHWRKKLGIPRCPDSCKVNRDQKGKNLVEVPDWIVEQFGKVSDRELSQQCGLSKNLLARRRRSMGIPAPKQINYNLSGLEKGKRKIELPDWAIAQLGQMPDSVLAKKLGFSGATIRKNRESRGIRIYRKRNETIAAKQSN